MGYCGYIKAKLSAYLAAIIVGGIDLTSAPLHCCVAVTESTRSHKNMVCICVYIYIYMQYIRAFHKKLN